MTGVTLRLRALNGTPLDEPAVREHVVQVAHQLAAANGLRIASLETTGSLLLVTVEADSVVAVGLLSELRRATNTWYEDRYKDGPLWGTGHKRS